MAKTEVSIRHPHAIDADVIRRAEASFEAWRYDHERGEERVNPFSMTLKEMFVAGFSAGHNDGKATMVRALIDFADGQKKADK